MNRQFCKLITCILVICSYLTFCGCDDTSSVGNGTDKDAEVVIKDSVLPKDETWEPEYTYIVEGTLEIPSGTTLEVLPGTLVKFGRDAHIKVRGTLKIGTPLHLAGLEESVMLTSNKTDPESGDWMGILFDHTHDIDSFIRGTVVEYADIAIDLKTASPTVMDCVLRNNNTAVALDGSDSKILYNTIIENGIGISTIERQNRPRIEYNNIMDNDVGIWCENVQSIIEFNNLKDNDYSLRLNVKFHLSVPNNWWGTTLIDDIDIIILDAKDTDIITKPLGTVIYMPFAEKQFSDAGPRN